MTNAHRDLATPELWTRSLARSRRRRELLAKGRREHNRRKHISAALATAVVAGPSAPLAAAQVSGDASAAIAAESPANRAIEIREGGLPLQLGSEGELVAHVQKELHVTADGIFGVQTDAAVRNYQARAGLEVDGIVGLATWGSLFGESTASGAALGGANIPPAVRERVEERIAEVGQDLAADGQIDGSTGLAAPAPGAPPADTPAPQGSPAPPSAQTPTTTPAPNGSACGSSTISSPVSGTVTSNFGPRGGRNHDGIDIAAPTGTPVRAAACGTVSLAGQQSGYGNMVCITHTSQFSTCYAHLSRFGVTSGAQVRQGQVIGYVGCTGNCTGPHLHFETRVGGRATDPRAYLGGASIPGQRANVAGASTSGAQQSSTGADATVTEYGVGGPTEADEALVWGANGGAAADATVETTAPAPVPAETVDGVAPAPVPAETTVDGVAPVPVEAAPVPVEAAPVPVETAPVPVETAPVPVEAAPVPVEAAPAPVETTPAPVETAPVPVEAAPAPVETAPVPVETAPAPVEAAPVPVEVAPAPVETAPVPVEAAAAPVDVAVDAGAAAAPVEAGVDATASSGEVAAVDASVVAPAE
jgi:murein DD-endopeptidase MepM/ murein hydrolase activator NlpD